ncbi:MAG: hypothetical protein ACSHW1_06965 [Yoonia sp.]|uniref:hypothetical protein n=1 Tax=Yoonia sp. TaxID=2212373 RepID=UPI003EF7F2EB
MVRVIAALSFLILASPSYAQDCPAFFRFVDFGLEGRDGEIYRGGTVVRAEGFDGQPLLLRALTACLPVEDVAKDGRGNPIPVVTSIDYDPEAIDLPLTTLRVTASADPAAQASRATAAHRERLEMAGTTITDGSDFRCASPADFQGLSCQFVSPYPGNGDLVVYCDAARCEMPALAINTQLIITARWPSGDAHSTEAAPAAQEIQRTIQQIANFLNPLMSGL